ncbi:helix-turn-helix transcriptional regulator [Dongia sp.]|uniref:helix-turn-helix transcriptional regulator n=1 Tax=Dongia sp. TaxID=1977262 RepID=UPI0035B32A30
MKLGRMDEAAELSATIERIYDAALDQGLWPTTLAAIAAFVEGYSAAIFSKSSSLTDGALYHHDGRIAPEFQQAYFTRYIKLDPANTLQYFAELEVPVSVSSLVPLSELADTRFYREWAAPQGLIDFVTVALEKSVASAALFGVFRHESQGIADDLVLRRMALIAPHVRRAVFIGRAFDLKTAEHTALADTLDGMSGALFLVDAEARIVHANAVAYRALERQDLCLTSGGRFAFLDRAANGMLKAFLTGTGTAAQPGAPRDLVLALDRADEERFIAHILPLAFHRARARKSGAAAAVIYLQRAALEMDSAPAVIAKAHGLTPTELRVLLAIVEIGGVPETAESLGIGEGTVKTHLRRVFAKTGAVRQADLVKLVATHASPLRGSVPATRPQRALAMAAGL